MSHICISGRGIEESGSFYKDFDPLFDGYAKIDFDSKSSAQSFDFCVPGAGVLISGGGGVGKSTFVKRLITPDSIIIKHGERDVSTIDNSIPGVLTAFTAADLTRLLFKQLRENRRLIIVDSMMRYMTGGDALAAGGFNYELGFLIADLASLLRDRNQTVIFILNARRDTSVEDQVYERVVGDAASNATFVIRMDDINTIQFVTAHEYGRIKPRPQKYRINPKDLRIEDGMSILQPKSDNNGVDYEGRTNRNRSMRIVSNIGGILKR